LVVKESSMNADFSNFYNDASALLPVLVLTKTVSFRTRHGATSPKRISARERRNQYLHVLVGLVGEGLALFGVWSVSRGWVVATLVAIALGVAAVTLALDLLDRFAEPAAVADHPTAQEVRDQPLPGSRRHGFTVWWGRL
jgi:hypothetical protein